MKTEPFAWWHKAITRRIREQVVDKTSALAVYLGLCEVASDAQRNDAVTVTQGHLASLSGLTTRTVRKRLEDLERIGAIRRQAPPAGPRCADVFDLLDPPGNGIRAMGNESRSPGNGFPTMGNGQGQTVSGPYMEKESITPRAKGKRLTSAEGIRLTEELQRVESNLRKLRARQPHEREPDHKTRIQTLEARIGNLRGSLGANADAIAAGGDA